MRDIILPAIVVYYNRLDCFRARSSGAERSAHNRLVVGSIPTEPTFETDILVINIFWEYMHDNTEGL